MSDAQTRRDVLKELLDTGELVNFTILTEDGGVFRVHLEVLVGKSPYIKSILTAAKNRAFGSILIPNTSRDVVANIINFMYTGNLQVSFEKLQELLDIGKLLVLPDILKFCSKFLTFNLNNEKCIAIYNLAKENHFNELKAKAKSYILAHFQKIFPVSSDYLKYLGEEDLVSILSSDTLNVHSEEYVFWALMRWVESDPTNRKRSLPNLLRCIRFGLCDVKFYDRNIVSNPYISASEDCQSVLLQASQVFEDVPSPFDGVYGMLDIRHPFLRPRTPSEVIFVIGGWSAGSATNVIETFDVVSGRWFLTMSADHIARAYHGMLFHFSHIYLIGGFDGQQCFNTVRSYDPVEHTWMERGCMYEQRCYVSVAAIGKHIYAMGGYDGHRRNRSCERYDPDENQWEMVAPMNQVRSDASADALNGKIYIAGGFNGHQVLRSAEFYDPESNVWTDITDMHGPRSGVKMISFLDHIYVLGGFNGQLRLSTVEKYNPINRTWSPVPEMTGPRSNFATAILYDCLYVIGGFNGLVTISSVECFCPRRNTWIPVTELNLNRSALACCTVRNIPNLKDYSFLGNAPNQ